MKALSIRQPWAWLILHGGKDVENRDWSTIFRGPLLIHASKGMTRDEYDEGADYARALAGIALPPFTALPRGAIVGQVQLVNCVMASSSPWFHGRYGWVFQAPQPYRPCSWRGALGLFEVPAAIANYLQPLERDGE